MVGIHRPCHRQPARSAWVSTPGPRTRVVRAPRLVTLGLGARPTRASLGAPGLAVHPHGWASTRGEGRRAHPPTLRQGTARGAGETPRLRHILKNDRAKPPLRQAVHQRGVLPRRHPGPRPNGKTLIVAHAVNGQLDTVEPTTGASATTPASGWRGSWWPQGGYERCTPPTRGAGSGWRQTLPPGWSSGYQERPVLDPDYRRPLRESPGGGQRQVRHRHPAQADQYEMILVHA